MKSRYQIYKEFKQFKQQKDTRSMEQICQPTNGFNLQIQQSFLKEYITKYPDWRSILLYHQIGSGKTCTAITLAEQYMSLYPNMKVTVILPARLRTNFVDELISPCGMEKYLSNEDFERYFSSDTSETAKRNIKKKFMKEIEKTYNIISYEKFRNEAYKKRNLRVWVKEFTKNRLIIVDEVHNLVSDNYDSKTYKQTIKQTGILKRVKGVNTILMKYMNDNAHRSCKMLYLTATPVFDNLMQFRELVQMMNPEAVINKGATIKETIEYLRGKVSFFPGTSPKAYPKVVYETHSIPLSTTQDNVIDNILKFGKDVNNESTESFMVYQRMASVASLPGNPKISDNIDRIIENQLEYAPKIEELMKNIATNPGKHVVYSTFVQSGVHLVEAALRKEGWISLKEAKELEESGELTERYDYKVYAIWDGSVKDSEKILIKSNVNKLSNIDGKYIRVIIGSPSIKEGVSFKHAQHMHLLDPVWNSSAKNQIEGRVIRFCSHIDIPRNHEYLERKVIVHLYKSVPRRGGLVQQTCDQEIYDNIIPQKEKVITIAEKSLKEVALDKHLFKKLYIDNASSPISPPAHLRDNPSAIENIEGDDAKIRNKSGVRKGKTCPKPRRPNGSTCPSAFPEKRPNKHGEICCYKQSRRSILQPPPVNESSNSTEADNQQQSHKIAMTCPKPRRPDAYGNCREGYEPRVNKHGALCCYKA